MGNCNVEVSNTLTTTPHLHLWALFKLGRFYSPQEDNSRLPWEFSFCAVYREESESELDVFVAWVGGFIGT